MNAGCDGAIFILLKQYDAYGDTGYPTCVEVFRGAGARNVAMERWSCDHKKDKDYQYYLLDVTAEKIEELY